MTYNSNLDKELLARLERDGPIDVAVSLEEYEQNLLQKARVAWNYPDEWYFNTERQAFFLLFLRGYSFYKELSENENEFWHNFPFSKPQNKHYDALEKTLKSDGGIQELFVTHQRTIGNDLTSCTSNRRAFVTTIDNIWGIRSLNSKSLERLFRRYYFNYPDQEVTKELIRLLLRDENPEIQDRAVRQSTSYNRIFQGLYRAIQSILEQQIETNPLETLSERMRTLGFVFDEPNPIEFFRNKAEAALEHLLRDLRGQVKPQKRSGISLAFEDDGTEQKATRRTSKTLEIVRFPNGVYQYNERITLEFDHLPAGMRRLELTGVQTQRLEFSGNSIRLPILEVGETTV